MDGSLTQNKLILHSVRTSSWGCKSYSAWMLIHLSSKYSNRFLVWSHLNMASKYSKCVLCNAGNVRCVVKTGFINYRALFFAKSTVIRRVFCHFRPNQQHIFAAYKADRWSCTASASGLLIKSLFSFLNNLNYFKSVTCGLDSHLAQTMVVWLP